MTPDLSVCVMREHPTSCGGPARTAAMSLQGKSPPGIAAPVSSVCLSKSQGSSRQTIVPPTPIVSTVGEPTSPALRKRSPSFVATSTVFVSKILSSTLDTPTRGR